MHSFFGRLCQTRRHRDGSRLARKNALLLVQIRDGHIVRMMGLGTGRVKVVRGMTIILAVLDLSPDIPKRRPRRYLIQRACGRGAEASLDKCITTKPCPEADIGEENVMIELVRTGSKIYFYFSKRHRHALTSDKH